MFKFAEYLYYKCALDINCDIGIGSVITGKTLHVSAGGTAKGYEGKGVGTMLRKYVLTHAEKHSFDRVVVEPANGATMHMDEQIRKRMSFETKDIFYHLKSIIINHLLV